MISIVAVIFSILLMGKQAQKGSPSSGLHWEPGAGWGAQPRLFHDALASPTPQSRG